MRFSRFQRFQAFQGFQRPLGFLAIAAMVGCSSPTSPGACVNGHDGLGRGPVSYLIANCVPGNSEVHCQSTMEELGYCASGPVDVTATTQWISTNSSVAVSTGPGRFQLQGPGATVIFSETGYSYSMQAFAYQVAAGGGIQQIGVVEVDVWSKTTGGFIPGATVDFTSATSAQTCQQLFGTPTGLCRFWTDFSPAVVRASAPGYTTVQQSVTSQSTGDLAHPISVVLNLTPSP